jgi:hypothetical protein
LQHKAAALLRKDEDYEPSVSIAGNIRDRRRSAAPFTYLAEGAGAYPVLQDTADVQNIGS